MKICNKCKQEKPLSEFNKNKSYKDGLDCYCKECRKSYGKGYRKFKFKCNYDCFNCPLPDCNNNHIATKEETQILEHVFGKGRKTY